MTESASQEAVSYAGFWIRSAAALIDSFLTILFFTPLYVFFPALHRGLLNFLFSWIVPAAIVILFWRYKSATPGKMVFSLRIVSADGLAAPSWPQLAGRYLAYFVSLIPLCLGYLWVGLDPRKRGWHDKLSGTAVIRAGEGHSRSKVIGVLLAAVLLSLAVIFVVGKRWLASSVGQMNGIMERVKPEAESFAKTHDQAACLDEGVRRANGSVAVAEMVGNNLFLSTCLAAAAPTPGLCDGIPPRNEFMKTAAWAAALSKETGCDGHGCGQLFTTLQEFCQTK